MKLNRKWWAALPALAIIAIILSLWPRTVTATPAQPIKENVTEQTQTQATTTDLNATPTIWKEWFVDQVSIAFGVNPTLSKCIVTHESQWTDARGDDGNSLGWWQISRIYHPEVPSSTSHSFVSSTIWSVSWIASGHIRQWMTYAEYCSRIPVFLK